MRPPVPGPLPPAGATVSLWSTTHTSWSSAATGGPLLLCVPLEDPLTGVALLEGAAEELAVPAEEPDGKDDALPVEDAPGVLLGASALDATVVELLFPSEPPLPGMLDAPTDDAPDEEDTADDAPAEDDTPAAEEAPAEEDAREDDAPDPEAPDEEAPAEDDAPEPLEEDDVEPPPSGVHPQSAAATNQPAAFPAFARPTTLNPCFPTGVTRVSMPVRPCVRLPGRVAACPL